MTIEPVVIEGDAGARQLVPRYEQSRRTPDCSLEAKEAALSCAKAGVAAVAGGLSARDRWMVPVFLALAIVNVLQRPRVPALSALSIARTT